MNETSFTAAIADLEARIKVAKTKGDHDPQNKLSDMLQALQWHKDQIAALSAGAAKSK
jgi:hypothetical protein